MPTGASTETKSIRPVEENTNPSISLIDPSLVDSVLYSHQDLIDPKWVSRHAKLIYLKGVTFYEGLALTAYKRGNNPKAMMAVMVGKEIKAEENKRALQKMRESSLYTT